MNKQNLEKIAQLIRYYILFGQSGKTMYGHDIKAYTNSSGAKKGQVFVSSFVGRLDDRGENGVSLVKNILTIIITAPFKVLKEWADEGMLIPNKNYKHNTNALKDIPYLKLDLTKNWQDFNITHELTDKGIDQFAADWNSLKLIQL